MPAISFLSILSFFTLLSTAFAHFTLDYPPTRGFDEDSEPQFCGGFPTPSSIRTPFSLFNTSMAITSHHTTAAVSVLISLDPDPTSFFQFSNGTTLPLAKSYFIIPEGPYCFFIDLSTSLASQNIQNGTEATLQVRFDGGDGDLFQCTDVVLLTDYIEPSNSTTCAASVSTDSNSTLASAASTSASTSKASTTQNHMLRLTGPLTLVAVGFFWALA